MKISEQMLRESFRHRELSSELPIIIFNTTGSTNSEARAYLQKHKPKHALFIADTQSAGRGRLGRSFISPSGGLYMSLAVRMSERQDNPELITSYAAVTVRQAIAKLTGKECQIKWVNDIILNGKKLAGILTEGVISPDTNRIEYAIIGIGVNILGSTLAPEISEIATTLELCGATVTREELCARITDLFLFGLDKVGTSECAEEYRRHSMLIGKEITVYKKDTAYAAFVKGISDKCELILELEGGYTELLSTGEVSVRVK